MEREQSSMILRRARAGSSDALNALFEQCGEPLLAYVRLRLGASLRTRLDSGDILQSTLLRAFTHIDQFEGLSRKSLMAWLSAIARNEVRDQARYHGRERRDRGRTLPLDESVPGLAEDVRSGIGGLILKEETQLLEQALESLSEDHREVILLRRYEELSFPEIGQRLGKSSDACRMLYARAMAKLTRSLQHP